MSIRPANNYPQGSDGSNSHYGLVTPRRVRAPGLHPLQNRPLVGRVPPPGVPTSYRPGALTRRPHLVPNENCWSDGQCAQPMKVIVDEQGTL
jgi:hypothetical protein